MRSAYFRETGPLFIISKEEARFQVVEIFRDLDYARHEISLQKGDVIFDIGANIGLFSIYASQECKGDLTIYAFEPLPPIFEVLRANLKKRGLTATKGVHVYNMGLSHFNCPDKATFRFYKNMPGNTTMKPDEKTPVIDFMTNPERMLSFLRSTDRVRYWGARIANAVAPGWLQGKLAEFAEHEDMSCPLSQLSKVIDEHNVKKIDLLKIDVEGAELDVLRGLRDDHWPFVKQAVLEVNDIDDRVNTIKALLSKFGFKKISVEIPDWSKKTGLGIAILYARRT